MTGTRTPLIEHVNELRRRSGSRRDLHRTMVADALSVTTARVPDGADVTIDGVLESIPGGIVVDGEVGFRWMGECRRCLTDIDGVVTIDIREVFETEPVEGETWPMLGDDIDLGPMLRDTVLLALPLAPLCSPDCLGPAPEAFPTVVAADRAESGAGDPPVRDPRWAALDQLRSD